MFQWDVTSPGAPWPLPLIGQTCLYDSTLITLLKMDFGSNVRLVPSSIQRLMSQLLNSNEIRPSPSPTPPQWVRGPPWSGL